MAKLAIKPGSTSVSVDIFIQDSSVTTGAGLTGLVYNTGSLVAYYHRPGAAAVAITLATLAAVTTAWTSGGFREIDATNMPGWYRLDLPDAVLATGVRSVGVHLKGASNMVPCPIEIDLSNDSNLTYWAGTVLPASDTAGYPKVTLKSGTGTGEVSLSSGLVRLSGTAIADVLDTVVENNGSITLRGFLRLAGAILFGRTSNGGETFATANNAKTRVTATTDASNNRTAIVLDATD